MRGLSVKKKEEMFLRKTSAKITKTQVGGVCGYISVRRQQILHYLREVRFDFPVKKRKVCWGK